MFKGHSPTESSCRVVRIITELGDCSMVCSGDSRIALGSKEVASAWLLLRYSHSYHSLNARCLLAGIRYCGWQLRPAGFGEDVVSPTTTWLQ